MKNVLFLFLLAALFSPSFLFMKVGLGGFPPLTLAACRVGIAAALVCGYLRLTGHVLPRTLSLWRHFAFMGIVGNAIPFAMFCMGETQTDSGPAAILNSTTPIFTVLLAHLFAHDERVTGTRLGGVLIGFLGIVTLFYPTLGSGFLRSGAFWGYMAFLTAALCYGMSSVYARRHLRQVPAPIASTAQLICATLFLAPLALVFERPYHIQPGLASVAAVTTLAVFGTALAMTLFYELLRRTSATFVSLVTYILPPAGIALGAVFLDEHVGWNHLAGCALILASVMLVSGMFTRMVRRVAGREPSHART